MKILKLQTNLSTLAAVGLFVSGCASPNVNPPQARSNTGYVDFHTEPTAELSWDVNRFDEGRQTFKRVFHDYEPIADGVLRLSFTPGHYRLSVTFLNRTVLEPALAEVDVAAGMITPVLIAFNDEGTGTVKTRSTSVGGTVYGRRGRRTKIEYSEDTIFGVTARPEQALLYRPKEQMPYTLKQSATE